MIIQINYTVTNGSWCISKKKTYENVSFLHQDNPAGFFSARKNITSSNIHEQKPRKYAIFSDLKVMAAVDVQDLGRMTQGLTFVSSTPQADKGRAGTGLFGTWGSSNQGTTSASSHIPPGKILQPAPAAAQKAGEDDSVLTSIGNAFSSVRTIVAGGEGGTSSSTSQLPSIWSLNGTTLMYFALSAGVGALFMFLSLVFLPMLVFAPQKFTLLFTLGSIGLLNSLAILQGYKPLLNHLTTKHKLPFTVAYVTSLIVTIYATLVVQSYMLTILSCVVQLISLFSFLVSYLPGGIGFLTMMKDSALAFFWSFFRRGGSSTVLPL